MSGKIEICFPEDQQEGTEASVSRWLVDAGDRVTAHEAVVEIETDKVVVEVAAPATGVITDIRIRTDEAVNPGDVLCTLATDAETQVERTPASPAETVNKDTPPPKDRLSPAVRQRVLQHKLDVSNISGSGRGGRITLNDVESLIAGGSRPLKTAGAADRDGPANPDTEVIPHDKMRKRIAGNMVTSLLHTAPHVTAVFEADLTAVLRHRALNQDIFASRGTPLTLTVYFVAATIAAIRKVPRVNSRWFDDHLAVFKQSHVGIGTALGDDGLIVPVLHNAQYMDLDEIAAGMSDLTTRARNGQLKPEDVRGGTFTISNHGVSGSLFATPIIINQPQSAILGVGKIEKRIRIREIEGDDVITIRPMCYISLTVDHRVVDGYQTNAFLTELVSTLENWS